MVSKLQEQIMKASQAYYTNGSSLISDEKFDMMLDQLKEEDPESPLLTDVGHGYDVALDTTPGEKIRHKYGNAGSLPKCHDWKEYSLGMKPDSITKIDSSLKLDGMSIVLYYQASHLELALTRGSGEGSVGINITNKVRKIDSSLLTLNGDKSFTGAIRGEIVMSYDNFEKFEAIHEGAKNPRNSAVGLINSKDTLDSDLAFLDIVTYNVVGCDANQLNNDFKNYSTMHRWLTENMNNVVYSEIVDIDEDNFEDIMASLRDKWYGTYPADGIVLMKESANISNNSEGDFYITHDGIAFKYRAESAITTVTGVEWNLSKTKYLIPRVNFETVELSGTNVSWAAGNNALAIKDRGIGIGSEIEVLKSGEIIPFIEDVIKRVCPELPTHCPCCNSELVWEGVHLACPNRECADADVQDLLVWCQNIAPYFGLGDLLKIKFFNSLLGDNISIKAVYDLGRISRCDTPSVQYNNFIEMYNMLFDNKVDLITAIKALNIPRISEVNASKLAQFPGVVKQLMNCEDVTFKLDQIKVIGEANCASILDNSSKFSRLKYIESNIDWAAATSNSGSTKVVITGKLSISRKQFEQILKEKGYVLQSSVNKETFCLITDDPNSNSSKNAQANKLNIPKLSESEFTSKYLQ